MKLDASKPIKSVNLNGEDAPLDILNIAYGTTPPADVTRLWVPLENRPNAVEISGDSLQNAVDVTETKLAVLNSAMCKGSAVSINNKAYIFGGYGSNGGLNTVQEYDPVTDTVIAKTAKFVGARCGAPAVAINGKAYIFGGGAAITGAAYKTIHEYDPISDTLTDKTATLDGNRHDMPAVAINGKAYIFGGDTSGTSTATARYEIYEYDPSSDMLTRKSAQLPESKAGASAVAINGKAYIFGGKNGSSQLTKTVYEYDPITDSIRTMSATFDVLNMHTSAVAINGKAYIFGVNKVSESSKIYEYDPVTDTMRTMTSVLSIGGEYLTAATVDNVAYIFGGKQSGKTIYMDAIRAFTPKAFLGENNLKIFASVYRSEVHQIVTNIVNNGASVKLYMTSAFIGDEEGYAKSQDAYVFNKDKQVWQALDGTSMTTDMLNALAELGVT